MNRVGSIVIRVDDLERQAEFWQQAVHYERRVDDSFDFVLLFPGTALDRIGRWFRSPPAPAFTTDSPGSIRRRSSGRGSAVLDLGATRIYWDKQPADADYVILAEPEGNRFGVVDAGA